MNVQNSAVLDAEKNGMEGTQHCWAKYERNVKERTKTRQLNFDIEKTIREVKRNTAGTGQNAYLIFPDVYSDRSGWRYSRAWADKL